MCTFFANISLTFSDLRRAVCMRSVLNPDSTTVVKSCISPWLWIVSVRCTSDLCCRVESLATYLIVAYVRNDGWHADSNQSEWIQFSPIIPKLVQTIAATKHIMSSVFAFFPHHLAASTVRFYTICLKCGGLALTPFHSPPHSEQWRKKTHELTHILIVTSCRMTW